MRCQNVKLFLREPLGSTFRGSGFPAESGIKPMKEGFDSETNTWEAVRFLRYSNTPGLQYIHAIPYKMHAD